MRRDDLTELRACIEPFLRQFRSQSDDDDEEDEEETFVVDCDFVDDVGVVEEDLALVGVVAAAVVVGLRAAHRAVLRRGHRERRRPKLF